jgi:hypothetical protein
MILLNFLLLRAAEGMTSVTHCIANSTFFSTPVGVFDRGSLDLSKMGGVFTTGGEFRHECRKTASDFTLKADWMGMA